MVRDINDAEPLFSGPLLTFDQWADCVEASWEATLRSKAGVDGARAAMATMRPMLAMASGAAYEEYVAGWKRRNKKR